jgi:BCCT family betaine/carnitine transporter
MISGLTIVLFVVATLLLGSAATNVFVELRDFLTARFDWSFLLVGNVFVLLCLALIVSPLGKIGIGGRDAKPDYS